MVDLPAYTDSLFTEIIKLNDEIALHPSRKNVHQFRVEIKKLKALLRIFQHNGSKTGFDLPDEILKLYKAAGKVREWQLLEKRLTALLPAASCSATLPLLKAEEEKSCKRFLNQHQLCSAEHIQQVATSLMSWLPSQPPDYRQYFHDAYATIVEKLNKKKHSVKSMHQLRRRIKEIEYNLKISGGHDGPEQAFFPEQMNVAQAGKLLGKWHDAITDRKLVSHLLNDVSLSKVAQEDLGMLQKQLAKEATAMLAKFKHDINQFRK